MVRACTAREEAPRADVLWALVATAALSCTAVDPESTSEPATSLTPSASTQPNDGGAGITIYSIDVEISQFLPDGTPRYPACAPPEGLGGDSGVVQLELGTGDLTVLVVFDKSTSMDWNWDSRTRWEVANDALVAALLPNAPNLTVAALLFPQGGNCAVSALTEPDQIDYRPGRAFLDEWMSRACWPKQAWGTPLGLALGQANAAIDRAVELGLLDDRFRVMVVTDGEPNCEDDEGVMIDYPRQWSERGIDTHVIGLPGSETASVLLDAIAEAGGTGVHFSPGTPEHLEGEFAAILK